MQFLVIGKDGDDTEALARRMAAREAHLALGAEMRKKGTLRYAAAILDDDGKMIGSAMFLEFEDRQKLDDWLEDEPYVKQGVWKKIDIVPCKAGPGF